MMTSPVSATPESSHWSGLTCHTAPRLGHRPIHDSPLLQGCNAGSSPLKHHSTPQKLGLPAPMGVGSKLTPVRYYESKLLSTIRSPCQKSYTPLSATPSGTSPAFKTPIRMCSTHSPHPTRTPVGTKLPKSASNFITPQSQIINPFEDRLLSTYHGSVLSPGGLALTDTPGSEEQGSFRWTIDQLAILHPADIDEMSCEDSHKTRFDKEVEETAQRAISEFFAKNNIVPSPWQGPNGKPVFVGVPKSSHGDCDKSCDNGTKQPKQSQDAACQTTLTLPMDFDLKKILGEFMTYQGCEEEANQQEALSTSSLRRKLFFHCESSPATTPVGKVEEGVAMQCDGSPRAVPLKPFPFSHTAHSGSPQFSSSPITISKGGPFSRLSEEMDGIISPELSPINLQQSPVRRSSDRDGNLCGSFISSPLPPPSLMRSAFRSQHNAMASPELSPIGPGPKSQSRLSLDVPPICSPVVRINDIHSPRTTLITQENTPTGPSHPASVSIAMSTPSTVGTSKVSENSVIGGTTLVTTPRLCIPSETSESCANPVCTETKEPPHVGEAFQHARLVMSDISMDVTGMETDYVVHSTGNPLLTNLPDDDKSLCYPTSRECSMLFEETTQQGSVGNVPTSQHSQDTGYQTCSLQLTGQDTGLHTNLTQQFGSLPFRSFSEADCMDEGIEQGNPLPKPVIFKERLEAVNTSMVSRQLSYPPTSKSAFTQQKVDCLQTKNYLKTELEGCALIQEGLTEDQVIAKARYLLGQTASVTSALPTKPSAELLGVSSQPDTTVPHLTWQPSCSSTPQKTISHSATAPSQPPSEVAMAILRRAEKDLVQYGSLAMPTESA